MKLGIYGGMFNPIHNGHVATAKAVRERLELDKVVFVPAFVSPFKTNEKILPALDRMVMIDFVIQDDLYLDQSMIEILKCDVSYTIDTVIGIRNDFNITEDELFLLVGADILPTFHRWHRYEDILDNCNVVVHSRVGYKIPEDLPFIDKITIVELDLGLEDISSSIIRERIKKGLPYEHMVHPKVAKRIWQDALYSGVEGFDLEGYKRISRELQEKK